jgi:hypothetical protein
VADWRDASAYEWLARYGRHAFTWEWLRRREDYRVACGNLRHEAAAGRFGLHRCEDWNRDSRAARPIWQYEIDPFVLTATALVGGADTNFDLKALKVPATVVPSDDGEHWLLGNGASPLRIDVVAGTLKQGPVALAVQLSCLTPTSLTALARLVNLVRDGEMRPSLFPAERRAARWAQVLRVHDALTAGASQREISDCLFGTGGIARWRVNAAPWRRRTQRLVEAARRAAATDAVCWLDSSFP